MEARIKVDMREELLRLKMAIVINKIMAYKWGRAGYGRRV